MSFFIEVINDFYKDEKNMAEFKSWKEERKHNDEIDLDIEGGSVPNGYRYDRVNRN